MRKVIPFPFASVDASLSPGDVPTVMEIEVGERDLHFSYVYPAGMNEPLRALEKDRVRLEIGKHSLRLFTIHVDTSDVADASSEDALKTFWPTVYKAISTMAREAVRSGTRHHYEAAADGLGHAPPAWMIEHLHKSPPSRRSPA